MGFKKIEDEVTSILKYNTAARADDMKLYAAYVYSKVEKLNLGDTWLQRVFNDQRLRISCGIAPYGSVSRIRRKVQTARPELRATEAEQLEKKRIERNYKRYLREKAKQ